MFDSFYPCYLHAAPGLFFTFSLNHAGGILLRWWRDQFAGPETADARDAGADPYALIDQRMPPGPSPVFVVPHLNGTGTPWCDLAARGAILGLTLGTTRHDVAKALLEGLAFELRINLENMQGCGLDIRRLAAAGGGAKSALWLQLKADILQRPIATLRCREAACLGAAVLAGIGAGLYHSVGEAVGQMVAADREYLPQPEMSRRYDERFASYSQLYPALKSLNENNQ